MSTRQVGAIKLTDGGLLMLPGHVVWVHQGKPVWMGRLDQLIEGLVFDEMILHADDIASLRKAIARPQEVLDA